GGWRRAGGGGWGGGRASKPPTATSPAGSMPRWRTSGSCLNPTTEVARAVSQVNVTINGRQYRMACEDGQEDHLRQLAKELDERINGLRGQFGEIGDSRLVVMAALMIADDVVEIRKKMRRVEQEMEALQDARGAAAER